MVLRRNASARHLEPTRHSRLIVDRRRSRHGIDGDVTCALLGRSTTDELTIMLRSITFAASLVGVASDCTYSGQTEPT